MGTGEYDELQCTGECTSKITRNPLKSAPNLIYVAHLEYLLSTWSLPGEHMGAEAMPSDSQTPLLSDFYGIWIPLWYHFGDRFLQNVLKMWSKVGSGRDLEKSDENWENSDTLEPSELCWRLHKTTIFTVRQCLQKGSQMVPKIIRFGHFGVHQRAMGYILGSFFEYDFQ